jgi:glycosyltransferase involved in cell wall biosynthesis
MKLAFFSPLNPQPSGISDYSEELLPALAEHADIDLYLAEGITPTTPAITEHFTCFPHTQFVEQHTQKVYDVCLYQMGNNTACHQYMDAYIQQYPGIVTLHDYTLHHFYAEMFDREQRVDEYQMAMERYYGRLGKQIAERFRQDIRNDYVYYQLPFYQRVVDPSLGTIVHSQYVKDKLLRYNPTYRVSMIPMGIVLPDLNRFDPQALRAAHGLPEDAFIIASLGFVIEDKRIRELLQAFAQFARDIPNAVCVLVGKEAPSFDVRALIGELDLHDKVRITGYVSYEEYFNYIALSDVCVNLRYPTVRATSANILKIMAFAKPVLISDLGELLDIPASACLKMPLDDTEISCIVKVLQRLYQDQEYRRLIGREARTFVETHHSLQQAARKYLDFCRETLDAFQPGYASS